MPCEEVGFIFSRRNGVKTDQIPTKKTNLSVWVGMATRPQWNTMEYNGRDSAQWTLWESTL